MHYGDLRAMLRYVPRFRGRTFVFSIDGGVLASDKLETVLLDLALLHSLSVRLVLCFGVTGQESFGGDSPTDDAALARAREEAGLGGQQLLAGLRRVGLRAALCNAVDVLPLGKVGGVDHRHTGRVDEIDVEALQALLEREQIPVLPPLGIGAHGEFLRVDSDRVAAAAAAELKAAKWIVLGAGELFPDSLRRQLSIAQAKELATESAESLAGRLRRGARACEQGVSRAHFLNGLEDGALLAELFSNEGVGHMIHADEYGIVRALGSTELSVLQELMRQSVEDELLVPRTLEQLEKQRDDFLVLEIDGNVVGCVALHLHGEGVGEMAGLHVRKTHEDSGHGRRLVEQVLQRARNLGLERVVALTTGARDYFIDTLGWSEIDPEVLPAARRKALEQSQRNSWVFETKV